jgi:hypothetical protein
VNSRILQRLFVEIDDIYFSQSADVEKPERDRTAQSFSAASGSMEEALGKSLFWCFINQPISSWFKENILYNPSDHVQVATMGTMMFFE